MKDEVKFVDESGDEWIVTLEAHGKVLSVDPEFENSGGNLPEHALQIVFRRGEVEYSEEYTGLSALDDLSDDDLAEWLDAAQKGEGV